MITQFVTCDICGSGIGMAGGAHVDLQQHDLYKTVLATYPPRYPGSYDLCGECRDALAAWLAARKKEMSGE